MTTGNRNFSVIEYFNRKAAQIKPRLRFQGISKTDFQKWHESLRAEIKTILGDQAERITKYYHTSSEGNWEHGRNILKRGHESELQPAPDNLKDLKKKLLSVRKKRIRPGLDDKILTGWNAMTIQGLIDAYKAFGDEKFLTLALETISFIEFTLIL